MSAASADRLAFGGPRLRPVESPVPSRPAASPRSVRSRRPVRSVAPGAARDRRFRTGARGVPSARVVRPTSRSVVASRASLGPEPGRLRLTRRGRVIALLLVAAAVYGAFGLGRASAGSESLPRHAQEVVVQSGDSLWSIAVRAMPHSDPRDAVAQLKSLNHLSGATVAVGERLRLP